MKNDKINLLLTISYCGSAYCGWQIQPNKKTIEGELENVLSKLFNEKITVVGSGRTDAGVHALKAKANVILPKDFTLKNFYDEKEKFNKLINVLNNFLPDDIVIKSIKKIPINFNARKSAKRKTYIYKVKLSRKSPFDANRFYFLNESLNVSHMQKCAKVLLGEHDFSSFCASKTSVTSFVRTIYSIKIKQSKNVVSFEICGNGFLYNMVRIIVGTLIEFSLKNIDENEMKKVLNGKNRNLAGKTAPACGLYLKNVVY